MGSKSRKANWRDGEKNTRNSPNWKKWNKLSKLKNLSPEFEHQILVNLRAAKRLKDDV